MKNFLTVMFACFTVVMFAQKASLTNSETVIYSVDTSCGDAETDFRIEVYFAAGFHDSVQITLNDSLKYTEYLETNKVTGMTEELLHLSRNNDSHFKIEIKGRMSSTTINANVGFPYIIVSRKGEEWIILYSMCPPIGE